MSQILDFSGNGQGARVDVKTNAVHMSAVGRGIPYFLSVNCGLQAAAVLAAGAKVFGMRLNPSSTVSAYFTQITVQTYVTTAFTTANNVNRGLGIIRANGAAFTGGTALATANSARIGQAGSQFNSANGGDMRFTNAIAGLSAGPTFPAGTTGAIFDAQHKLQNGAVNTLTITELIRPDTEMADPVVNPGDVLCLMNSTDSGTGSALAAFDAAGIIGIQIDLAWFEAALLV